MRQLAFIYAQQNTISAAAKMGEKALLLSSEVNDFPQILALRLLVAEIYQKIYEQTGLSENRQKAVFHLAILEKEFSKKGIVPPSVNLYFEQYECLKTYIEDINKPRFLLMKQEIHALEADMKKCKNTAQTIYYRSKIIGILQKLDNQLPHKSVYIINELANYYRSQAQAQNEQKNFREVEANVQKANKILSKGLSSESGVKNENQTQDARQNAMLQDCPNN